MRWQVGQEIVPLALSSLLLAGCAGNELPSLSAGGGMIASYGPSNALSPSGYSESIVGDNHYKIRANGTLNTPKHRVEKIAMARAAEIAISGNFKFFKVASVAHSVSCGKKVPSSKGSEVQLGSYPVVELEAIYAKSAADPTYVSAKETFDTLSAELAAEVVPPDAKTTAASEVAATCGRS